MTDVRRDSWETAARLVTAAVADDRDLLGDELERLHTDGQALLAAAALTKIASSLVHELAADMGGSPAAVWSLFAHGIAEGLDRNEHGGRPT